MSSGRPDFHGTMLFEGKYGTELKPVLVDANGQLYIVMTGVAPGTELTVFQAEKDRDIIGLEGSTRRQIAVDASGIILTRLQGSYGGALKDVAVDPDGLILAAIKGDYEGTLKTVAVTDVGVLKTDFFSQSLDFLRVRPVYGQARRVSGSTVVPSGAGRTRLTLIGGRGATIGGYVYWYGGSLAQGAVELKCDGAILADIGPYYAWFFNLHRNASYPLYALKCEYINQMYAMGVREGVTFEESFELSAGQSTGGDVSFLWQLMYSLVPDET